MKKQSYGQFAKVYDLFMRDIPYGEWADFVLERMRFYGMDESEAQPRKILELGCGTGNMAKYFCMEGYEVDGIDLSDAMVKEARRKIIPNFYAYTADMRIPFGVSKSYDCVISLCDSMNYLTNKSDIALALKAASVEVKDGGLLIFDLKHEEFYKELGDNTFSDKLNNAGYIWENYYDEKRKLNYYDITFYYRWIGRLYRSFEEHHIQRAYSRQFIEKVAGKYGFTLLECTRRDERDYYIFRK